MSSIRALTIISAVLSFHISFTASAFCTRSGNLNEIKKTSVEGTLKGILGGYPLENDRIYTWTRSDNHKKLKMAIEDNEIRIVMNDESVTVTKVCSNGKISDVHVDYNGMDAYIRIEGSRATAYYGSMQIAQANLSQLAVNDSSGTAIASRASDNQVGQR